MNILSRCAPGSLQKRGQRELLRGHSHLQFNVHFDVELLDKGLTQNGPQLPDDFMPITR